MPELLKACAGCGRAMNPNAVLYDADARPVCDACHAKADLLATDRRAADNIRKAGWACLGAGVGALFAPIGHVVFLVACLLVAGTSGVFVLRSLARDNERFTKHLTPGQRQLVWIVTITGLALGGFAAIGLNFALLIRPY